MSSTQDTNEPTPRRERKSEKTRRRILDAAAEVLNRDGFAGARLSTIAEAADLRVPAVYYYFDSREAILEEVVVIGGRMAEERIRARLAELPGNASAVDRICAAYGAQLEMVLKESAYTAAAMKTMGQLPAPIRERQLREQRGRGELWRGLIADAVKAGEIDPELEPHAARMLLLGAVNWAPEWWDPERGTIDELVATAERLVRNAFVGPGRRAPLSGTDRSARLSPIFSPPSR